MKNNQTFVIVLAIVAGLTLLNSYKIFFGSNSNDRTISTVDENVNSNTNVTDPNNNLGNNFPNVTPNNNGATNPLTPVESNLPKTTLAFDKMKHDFGNIIQNSENKYSFSFRNTGVEPLVISNAKGSCGCTVPNYPKDPVAPGATATIDVVYSPGMQSGNQTKTVTITANTDPSQTILSINANVLPDPNAPKPEGGGTTPISISPSGGQ